MGNECCTLTHLLCCPPTISAIVSKFAFRPPPVSYSLEEEKDGQLRLKNCIPEELENYVDFHFINKKKSRGTIAAIYINTGKQNCKDTILISHGNAVDIGNICHNLIQLGRYLEINILTYDYSGYGLSSGKPRESHLYDDAVSVLDYARTVLRIEQINIILYGQSIGTVPACYLAGKYKFACVILHSPLASGFHLVNVCNLLKLCPCLNVMNNLSRMKHCLSPTQIIHGTDDEVIPVQHGQLIYKAIPRQFQLEPVFIEGANHNNCELYIEYRQTIEKVVKCLSEFQNKFGNDGGLLYGSS